MLIYKYLDTSVNGDIRKIKKSFLLGNEEIENLYLGRLTNFTKYFVKSNSIDELFLSCYLVAFQRLLSSSRSGQISFPAY